MSLMPTVTVAGMLSEVGTITDLYGAYILIGLGVALTPVLIKIGMRLLKGRG